MFILQVTRVPSWAGVGLVGGVYITSDEGAKLGWSRTCRWVFILQVTRGTGLGWSGNCRWCLYYK